MKKIYTLYSHEGDITFIMEMEDTEEGSKDTVKGFYYGEPDEEKTKSFYDHTTAYYDDMKVADVFSGEDSK